jgi:hypothetical protein
VAMRRSMAQEKRELVMDVRIGDQMVVLQEQICLIIDVG